MYKYEERENVKCVVKSELEFASTVFDIDKKLEE